MFRKLLFMAMALLAVRSATALPAGKEAIDIQAPYGWYGVEESDVSIQGDVLTLRIRGRGDIPNEEIRLMRYLGIANGTGDIVLTSMADLSQTAPFGFEYRLTGDFDRGEFRIYDGAGSVMAWPLEKNEQWTPVEVDPVRPVIRYGRPDARECSLAEFNIKGKKGEGELQIRNLFVPTGRPATPFTPPAALKYADAAEFNTAVLGTQPDRLKVLPRPEYARRYHMVPLIPHITYAIQDKQPEKAIEMIASARKFFARLASPNCEFILGFGVEHDGGGRADDPVFVAGLEKVARYLEAENIPFIFATGAHMGKQPVEKHFPYMRRVVEEWAPNSCLGYYIAEGLTDPGHEHNIPYYRAMLESAAGHGKKVLWHHFLGWWWRFPVAYNELYNEFTAPQYREVLVPLYENLDSFNQYAAHDGAFGMWYSGKVADWGVSMQNWMWISNMLDFGRDINKMPNDILLRTYVQYASEGATYLQTEGFGQIFEYDDDNQMIPGLQFDSYATFCELIRRNYVYAVPAQYLRNVNPVALQLLPNPQQHTAMDTFLETRYQPDGGWGRSSRLRRLAKDNLGRNFYHVDYAYDDLLRMNDYGHLAIYPPDMPAVWSTRSFVATNGTGLGNAGKKANLEKAMARLKQQWRDAGRTFPVRTSGCWANVIQSGAGRYLVTAMDYRYRFAYGDVACTLELQKPGTVTDVISGEQLTAEAERTFPFRLPGGGIRFFEIIEE